MQRKVGGSPLYFLLNDPECRESEPFPWFGLHDPYRYLYIYVDMSTLYHRL